MAVNISLWESITFPLALLLWLHRVYSYVLSFFVRDRTLNALWDELHDADTFEDWEAAGLALDHRYRIDTWRKDDKSKLYAWELIGDRLAAFSLALRVGHIQALIHLLQSGLVRNLGNITVPPLYNESFAGTKYLIENYILQVCEIISDLVALPDGDATTTSTPLLSPDLDRALRDGRCGQLPTAAHKRQLFVNLRQSFGRTTLVFQGGSVFGLCHLGVARALFLRGLLPRILTGTGTGALIAALLGTHTDAELPGLLDGDTINLSAFSTSAADDKRRNNKADVPEPCSRRARLATLWRRLARLRSEGYLLDVSVLERCVRDNGGDLTFEEAYRRTGRILNITVVTGGGTADVPTLLNYVTAPNVLIWTAAVASNASEVAGYGHRQPAILCRDATGSVVAWPLADAALFRHWTHGRYDGTRQAPLQRLAQLFNVNHFVISQARPHAVPFLEPSMQSPAMRGLAAGTLARARALVLQQAGHLLRHRLDQMARLGWLPPALRRLMLDEQMAPLSGGGGGGGGRATDDGRSRRRYQPQKLVLVPHVSPRDYVRLLDAPSPAALRYWIGRGERAVWPAVAALKIRCSVELALQQAYEDLSAGRRGVGAA